MNRRQVLAASLIPLAGSVPLPTAQRARYWHHRLPDTLTVPEGRWLSIARRRLRWNGTYLITFRVDWEGAPWLDCRVTDRWYGSKGDDGLANVIGYYRFPDALERNINQYQATAYVTLAETGDRVLDFEVRYEWGYLGPQGTERSTATLYGGPKGKTMLQVVRAGDTNLDG